MNLHEIPLNEFRVSEWPLGLPGAMSPAVVMRGSFKLANWARYISSLTLWCLDVGMCFMRPSSARCERPLDQSVIKAKLI